MIDRLVHHAEVVSLRGDSYRLKDRDLGRPTNAAKTTDDNKGVKMQLRRIRTVAAAFADGANVTPNRRSAVELVTRIELA